MKPTAIAFPLATASVLAQGTFQNLDFESAQLVLIPGDPYGSVQFGPAFPGWSASVGGVPQPHVTGENDLHLDRIEFSASAIPEPQVSALLALGATMVWRFRRR